MQDLIHFVMLRAVREFGGEDDGMFNGACFSTAWKKVTGVKGGLDGHNVRAMLFGRDDVEWTDPLKPHYRLRRFDCKTGGVKS